MKIILNGKEKEIFTSSKLNDVILQFCKQNNVMIAEVNGEIVRKVRWSEIDIKNGDKIELINFVGGG